MDRDDVCLLCTNSVIVLNKELNFLLADIIRDSLNKDCIGMIVNYVIGKVIYAEFDGKGNDEIENDEMLNSNVNKTVNIRKRVLQFAITRFKKQKMKTQLI